MRTRIIFYNVTSEYDPAFVLLILKLQSESSMTKNELFCPYSLQHRSLLFRQLPCQNSLKFFPFASENFDACGIGMNLYTRLKRVLEFRPFCRDVMLMRFVSSSFQPWSRAFVGIDNTSVFCLAFPNIAASFELAV